MSDIRIFSTGGTIASTGGVEGARPEKDGTEILGDAAQAREHASISIEEVAHISSFTIGFQTMAAIVKSAKAAAKDGADGVVVTHGTDTMEESAFYADQTSSAAIPIIFTGAQRRPDEPSPDGPANVIGAVRAASHSRIQAAGGSYIVFDDQIHEAHSVMKTHTTRVSTFQSPDAGPVATIDRDQIRFHHELTSTEPMCEPVVPTTTVRVIPSGAGVSRDPIDEAVDAGVDGIVIQGTGVGNTTKSIEKGVADALDHGIPVVIGSRCPGGATMPVYGGNGGGQTLRELGVEFTGTLSVQKARIKLALALSTSDDPLSWFGRE